MSGAFVAVVGASGSGKDSVIGAARELLSGHDGSFVFPRRLITRPVGAGEDHMLVSEADFTRIEHEGGFALSWRAHGLAYGLPAAVVDAVRAGDVVVANVSRGVLDRLTDRFEHSAVVRVCVPEEQRRARLARRGREADAEIAARMNREDPAPNCAVDLEIVNDGPIEDAGRAFADFLLRQMQRGQ
ncbi:phosphonate metabolism protein/1,5-bisphosphokinase (PRPP-forming) PhnN [Microbacterium murale]|uniref:Ribose 1,5-bisphosphate phosphokinase PhnN n=1 Tax=Microbacterium murale TaxID=1081040 RepID=A0ABQ1S1I8_9MICO|nr:phosphonate metabolism protein/1,5-bisphosphokinase (PRPP-forming) PhnN [Microbacterium murale]GGD87485.1 ribose 1,5-bisphosphate phosphokinase PhnN [Microbacterium murale]